MKAVVLFAIVVGITTLVIAEDAKKPSTEGTCQCAAFKDEKEGTMGEPLISKTPGFKVVCDDQGKEDCKKMCIALAEAAKEKVPKALCETLKTHVVDLKPSAFYKACDAPEWSYTGLTSPDPICCHEGKPTQCVTVSA